MGKLCWKALALSGVLTATACGSAQPEPPPGAASTTQSVTPQRYRSDAGIVFALPPAWNLQTVGVNAALVPPGASFNPQGTDNREIYLVLGTEDATDLDAPELESALAALLAADGLKPEGSATKETLEADGRQARLYSWRGAAIPGGTLGLRVYLVRDGRFILMLVAAAETAIAARNDAALRSIAGGLAYDPDGKKFPDARRATEGIAPPSGGGGGSPGDAAAFAGVWTGKLTGRASSIDDAAFEFSPAGHLLYRYSVRGGEARSVEWNAVGQKVQYIPEGGGVQTITVEALDRGPGRLMVKQRWVLERSGNFLDQKFQNSQLDFTLGADGLQVRMATTSENFINGNPTGTESEVYTGVLKKK